MLAGPNRLAQFLFQKARNLSGVYARLLAGLHVFHLIASARKLAFADDDGGTRAAVCWRRPAIFSA